MPTVLTLLLLTACATPPQTRELFDNPAPISQQRELEHTPFYPQRDYQCGPAALASVLNLYGPVAEIDDLIDKVYVPELKGSLRQEMIAAAASYGFLPIRLDAGLATLLATIDEGFPVLVFQNLGLDQAPFWHYAVMIGYDLDRRELVLRSGERERLIRPIGNFERTWQRAGHWAMVAVAPGQIPARVTEAAYLDATLSLEYAGQQANLAPAYRAGVQRWPDSFVLLMGLGNASYAQGNFNEAETAFRQALELSPQRAEAWNNLAYSLAAQGRRQDALESLNRARTLQPDNAEFRHSETEIRAMPNQR